MLLLLLSLSLLLCVVVSCCELLLVVVVSCCCHCAVFRTLSTTTHCITINQLVYLFLAVLFNLFVVCPAMFFGSFSGQKNEAMIIRAQTFWSILLFLSSEERSHTSRGFLARPQSANYGPLSRIANHRIVAVWISVKSIRWYAKVWPYMVRKTSLLVSVTTFDSSGISCYSEVQQFHKN